MRPSVLCGFMTEFEPFSGFELWGGTPFGPVLGTALHRHPQRSRPATQASALLATRRTFCCDVGPILPLSDSRNVREARGAR